MPFWGRPPGARRSGWRRDERAREREERRRWEAQRRFEEVETEPEGEGEGVGEEGVLLDNYIHPHRFSSDELRFTGVDLSPAARDRRRLSDGRSTSSAEDEPPPARGRRDPMQVALRDKEESLAQAAVARMHRARAKGQPNVTLSQAEYDALLRRQPAADRPEPPTEPDSGSSDGADHRLRRPRLRPETTGPPVTVAGPRRRRRHSRAGSGTELVPAVELSSSRSTSAYQRRPRRSSPPRSARPEQARYVSLPEGSNRTGRPPSPVRRAPLPHEPGWAPRARATSAAHPSSATDPFQYQVYDPASPPVSSLAEDRRLVPGPIERRYGSVRRRPVGTTSSRERLSTSISDPSIARRQAALTDTESESESESEAVTTSEDEHDYHDHGHDHHHHHHHDDDDDDDDMDELHREDDDNGVRVNLGPSNGRGSRVIGSGRGSIRRRYG
ncbi:MAG: hypothetical protein M1838_004389 [Thelocarpon superellum]|nr:MAG: hypothetical protein M1838_004389 [Thelocarpon superellum]